MDSSENNIDHIFRERFTDAKDFSVAPEAAWQTFESTSGSATVSQAAISSAGKLSIIKLTAVFAGSLTIASVLHSDRGSVSAPDSKITYQYGSALPSLLDLGLEPNPHFKNVFTSSDSVSNGDTKSIALINPRNKHQELGSSAAPIDNKLPNKGTDQTQEIATSTKSISEGFISPVSPTDEKLPRNDQIDLLDILSIELVSSADIISAEVVEPEIVDWDNNHMWFLRAGLRVGSGESNSFEIESEWKANPSFSFGYGFSITDKSYITSEIGWLRRSGNGIERTTDVDLNPLINGLALNIYEGTSDDLVIHESLVATRMDYIHVPLNYNRQFAESWTFSAGGFVDLLISAKNDGYIVYNNTEYQASIAGKAELSSLDGLNRFRYGAMIGAEREIYHSFSAYGQLMVPLNSAIDSKSRYRIIDETNRLVDLKIGLTYRI